GTEFLNKTLHEYFVKERIEHQTSSARTPEQNGIVERWNRTLVEAARTMLSSTKVPLFFWDEAIVTACFTQNRSLIIPRHEKTPYHIINGQKPYVKFFYIFGLLCYIVRDRETLDKMKAKCDECIFVGYSTQSRAYMMASDQFCSDPVPQCLTMALEQDSLSPVPQSQENVPWAVETVTTSNELDFLFSLMFYELFNGSSPAVSKTSVVPTTNARDKCQQQDTTPSTSTIVAADSPPLNIPTTPAPASQAPIQIPSVTPTENINQAESQDENVQVKEDEFVNILSTPTKDHPLEQVIGNLSQLIRTRRQLETDGEMCMLALTVSRTKPKNIKEAMDDSAWIEAM
ncbi:integrase, catalytic region, zinc finger, CCHC-type containing protein, partial [Tanacetum coccineum]